jgi:hypothetical protein
LVGKYRGHEFYEREWFVVRADEKPTAFVELECSIRTGTHWAPIQFSKNSAGRSNRESRKVFGSLLG